MNTTTIGSTRLHRATEQCALNVAEAIVRALFHFAALQVSASLLSCDLLRLSSDSTVEKCIERLENRILIVTHFGLKQSLADEGVNLCFA
jgi:hypothetical protein